MAILYTGSPLKDADGKIVGALEYVVDYTDTRIALDDAVEKKNDHNNVPTPVMDNDKN